MMDSIMDSIVLFAFVNIQIILFVIADIVIGFNYGHILFVIVLATHCWRCQDHRGGKFSKLGKEGIDEPGVQRSKAATTPCIGANG